MPRKAQLYRHRGLPLSITPLIHWQNALCPAGNAFNGAQKEPYTEALEMSRVCLSPSVASNGESFTVAAALRLAAGHGVRGVVTYADPVARLRTLPDGRTAGSPRGHLGVIYQALSATYTGRSTARTVIVLPDGQVLPSGVRAGSSAAARPGEAAFQQADRAFGGVHSLV